MDEKKEVKESKEVKEIHKEFNKEVKQEIKQEVKKETEKIIAKKEEEKHNIIQKSKISLGIDNYSDIFSDFDPRDYSERAISQDFLEEVERASRDKKSGKIELNFLIAAPERRLQYESTIKKRLREHFKKNHKSINEKKKNIIKRGIYFVIVGIILMFAATFILFTYSESSLLTSFLVVFLEPAGWFFFWEGLAQIIFETKKITPQLEFYKKMSKSEINFFSG